MSDQQRSITFGYPEFWPIVVAESPEFFARMGKLEASLHSVIDRGYENFNVHQRVLLNMLMLVAYGFKEVIFLVGNGMGVGAMKIVRTVVEQAINACYLSKDEDELNRYLEWRHVEQFQSIALLEKVNPDLLKEIDPEIITKAKADYNRVVPMFQQSDQNSSQHSRGTTWAKKNLFERAKDTGFGRVLHEDYAASK